MAVKTRKFERFQFSVPLGQVSIKLDQATIDALSPKPAAEPELPAYDEADMPLWVLCSSCNGYGCHREQIDIDEDREWPCNVCNGEGEVMIWIETRSGLPE
jgi:hypothetical protein